ncbi:hypothetical protein LCGC14_0263180 [marine sediment metagenome]|uniref:Uncharacterized protein n=1 Tax=marine sediment metagenome TaxID=412755 RepID=A0A0F9X635_9ZZZZ
MFGLHRVVDSVLDGVANGVTGFVNSAAGAVKGAGKSVMAGLDKPFTDITGKQGPHRIIDVAADGAIDAGVNFVNQGIVGSAKKAGEGVMRALDHPLEQMGLDKLEPPRIFRK